MLNRKDFIRKTTLGAGLLAAGSFPFESLAGGRREQRLTILHTNDVHSRLEPFPADAGKFAGQGGIAARLALVEKIRAEEEQVLLLDAGDIFQGTPYFNLYKGEPEIKAMSLLLYDATTMGNHDFDAGVEGFAAQLPHANFPVLVANYDFSQTVLEGKTKPYQIFRKGGLKIGVFGLGIQLKGLVPDDAYGKTHYIEPVQTARSISEKLRRHEGCDLVICLSHLGYEYDYSKASDKILAKETEHIDLIIGGHTHTFLDEPTVLKNRAGREVVINQVGWAGLRLGRIDYVFGNNGGRKMASANTVVRGKQTSS